MFALPELLRQLALNLVIVLVRIQFPDVPTVSTGELARWLASNRPAPVLVDTRTEAEYAVSHLPGALNLTSVRAIEQAGLSPSHLWCCIARSVFAPPPWSGSSGRPATAASTTWRARSFSGRNRGCRWWARMARWRRCIPMTPSGEPCSTLRSCRSRRPPAGLKRGTSAGQACGFPGRLLRSSPAARNPAALGDAPG